MTMIMIPAMIPAKFEFNPGVAVATASDYVIVIVIVAVDNVVVVVVVATDTDVVVAAATSAPLLVDLVAIKKVLSKRRIQLRLGL